MKLTCFSRLSLLKYNYREYIFALKFWLKMHFWIYFHEGNIMQFCKRAFSVQTDNNCNNSMKYIAEILRKSHLNSLIS